MTNLQPWFRIDVIGYLRGVYDEKNSKLVRVFKLVHYGYSRVNAGVGVGQSERAVLNVDPPVYHSTKRPW